MKRAALGIRMHSGWGVLVALAGADGAVEVLGRTRIVTADPKAPGGKQPYHYAANLEPMKQEAYLAACMAASGHLAFKAIAETMGESVEHGYRVEGAVVLGASGRALPSLTKILASHALIHTAEGEFFRDAVKQACEALNIPVTAIRERDLDEQAKAVFGESANQVQSRISELGRSLGPPWTQDHKAAALAAAILLA